MNSQTLVGAKMRTAVIDSKQLKQAAWAAVVKLNPVYAAKSQVMFVVLLGTLVTAWLAVAGGPADPLLGFNIAVAVILLATVLFANFAEAIAEARGRGQAAIRRTSCAGTPRRSTRSLSRRTATSWRPPTTAGGSTCGRRPRRAGSRPWPPPRPCV